VLLRSHDEHSVVMPRESGGLAMQELRYFRHPRRWQAGATRHDVDGPITSDQYMLRCPWPTHLPIQDVIDPRLGM
jgi:hypothetical protein